MKKIKPNHEVCIGSSMYPTLQPADILITEPYKIGKTLLSRGDIIIFYDEEIMTSIVHRIVKISNNAIITRGDNNNLFDRPITNLSNIKKKVIKLKRNDNEIIIKCGNLGYIINIFFSKKKAILMKLSPIIRFSSKTLEESRILNFLGIFIKTKVTKISHKGEVKNILMRGKTVIGEKIDNKWQIKMPYKYFISKRKLN